MGLGLLLYKAGLSWVILKLLPQMRGRGHEIARNNIKNNWAWQIL